MERDDISSRTMVLCVSSVTVTENTATEQKDDDGGKDGQGNVSKMEVATSTLILFCLCNFDNLENICNKYTPSSDG